MVITELTLFRLNSHELSISMETFLHNFEKAQSDHSTYPAYFMRQTEDPALFYLIGGWESIIEHNEWIESETVRDLLGQLDADFTVEWRAFLRLDPSTSTIPIEAGSLGFSWCYVRPGEEMQFNRDFENGLAEFEAHTAPFKSCGGWRIDKDSAQEEFVLFSGWNVLKDHLDFSVSDHCLGFKKIMKSLTNVKVKHANRDIGVVIPCPEECVNPVWTAGIAVE